MALINCRECDREISSEAPACPHCGVPEPAKVEPKSVEPKATPPIVMPPKVEVPMGSYEPEEPELSTQPREPNMGVVALLAIVGVVVVFGGAVFFDDLKYKFSTPPEPKPTKKESPQSPKRYQYAGVVYAKSVGNIRSKPSTDSAVVGKVKVGEEIPFTGTQGAWYKLSFPEQDEKWIHESVVMTEREKRVEDSYQLAVLDWHWGEEHGYVTAEGQVKNISDSSLDAVQVVVNYYTAGGELITSDTGFVEYRPLLPGQTSPFKAMTKHNPAMKKAGVTFKHAFGKNIPFKK